MGLTVWHSGTVQVMDIIALDDMPTNTMVRRAGERESEDLLMIKTAADGFQDETPLRRKVVDEDHDIPRTFSAQRKQHGAQTISGCKHPPSCQ